jgi:hypothetical protein
LIYVKCAKTMGNSGDHGEQTVENSELNSHRAIPQGIGERGKVGNASVKLSPWEIGGKLGAAQPQS